MFVDVTAERLAEDVIARSGCLTEMRYVDIEGEKVDGDRWNVIFKLRLSNQPRSGE